MCQRAYFSFNLMTKENQIKSLQQEEEKRLDQKGPALNSSSRVTENQAAGSLNTSPHVAQLPLNNIHQQSQGSILDSVLDGSVHVGNKDKIQEESLTKLESLALDKKASLATGAPPPSTEEISHLQKAVTDLKWKLQYEQGLHKEMQELLESKVASYLVKINNFEETEAELKAKTESQEQQIEKNQLKIKQLCDQLSTRTIENEKLQFKIVEISENVVGMTKFEKLQSDLNIANSQIKYKNGKIESQQLEIEQLSLIIKEMHQKVTTAV